MQLFDLDGQVQEILAVGIDITERRQGEEAIKEQLNFQQILIDRIQNPIFYEDTEGG